MQDQHILLTLPLSGVNSRFFLAQSRFPAFHLKCPAFFCCVFRVGQNALAQRKVELRRLAETKFYTRKIMNSTVLPYFQFGVTCQGFAAASLALPAYVDGRKLENSSV